MRRVDGPMDSVPSVSSTIVNETQDSSIKSLKPTSVRDSNGYITEDLYSVPKSTPVISRADRNGKAKHEQKSDSTTSDGQLDGDNPAFETENVYSVPRSQHGEGDGDGDTADRTSQDGGSDTSSEELYENYYVSAPEPKSKT